MVVIIPLHSYFRLEVQRVFNTMRYVPAENVLGSGNKSVPSVFMEIVALVLSDS